MAGGSAYDKAIKEAQQKGQQEQQKQEQQAQQQKEQSLSGSHEGGSGAGTIITDPSAVGGRQGTRGNQQQGTTAEQTIQYANSLVNNAGLVAGSPEYFNALREYQKANNPDLVNNKELDQSIAEDYFSSAHTSTTSKASTKSTLPSSENVVFGYTSDAKLSPIVANFSKNPNDIGFTVTEKGQRQIDFFRASHVNDSGGVETPQSKDKSFGSEWTSQQPETIGATIFSNQKTLVRNSPFENKVKAEEAQRAEKVYPSFSNKDYTSGGFKEEKPVVTLGKAQSFFGNKTSFGWEDVSKDQLSRGSNAEKLSTTGLFAGQGNTRIDNQGGKPFEVAGGLTDKTSSRAVQVFAQSETNKPVSGLVNQPKTTQTPSESQGNVLSDKDFRAYLTREENQGAVFSIFVGNKKVGETSGARSYHDYLAAQKQFGNNVEISPSYPEVEKNIISNVKASPDYYEKNPSVLQKLGEKGYISPKGFNEIGLILHKDWFEKTAPIRAQDKAFRQSLTDVTNAGLGFNIKDSKGNVVATTQGPRAYHDYLAAQKQYGKDVTIEPKYEWSISDYFNKTLLEQPRSTPSGKPNEVISGLINSAKSTGYNLYALGLSTVQFAQKPDKSLNLGFGAKIPYSEQARQNIIGSLTFGVEPSKLLEGKIVYNQNIKLSEEGQKISEANKEPSYTNVQLGLEKPTKSTEYYSGQALFTGIMAGAMAYGLKDVIPVKTTTFPLPYTEGVKPARAVTFGTGGENDIILGGRGGGKFFRGPPKAENLNLNKLAPTTSREGFESGTGTPLQNKITTEVAVPALEKSGKLSKTGSLDILETGKEGSKLATTAPTIQFRGFGEKPFRSLTEEQTPVLLNFLKEKKFTVTGSTAEIPFTKEGFVSQARDVDIKGVKKEKAVKLSEELAGRLQEKALPGQTFEAKGTSVILTTKDAGLINAPKTESKILEFPQHEIQQGYGLTEEEKSFVFGTRVPKEKTKVEGLKIVTYDYQGLRKLASSTELHIGKGGDIIVRASSGREVKDPAHVFSYYKTKASNYFAVGKQQEGERLNQIAENYRSRHPELDFSKEYRSVNAPGTLELEQKPSVLSSVGSISSRNISSGLSKSSSVSSGSYGSAISARDLVSLRGSSASISKSKSSSLSTDMIRSKSLSSVTSKSKQGKYGSVKLSSRGGSSSKLNIFTSKTSSSKSKESGSSTNSSFSGLSGKSANSGKPSGMIIQSGFSGLSGSSTRSGFSRVGGSSGPLSFSSVTPTKPKILLPHGDIGYKRQPKAKEGPTALINLGVRNVFASSLNIVVGKGQRYEF